MLGGLLATLNALAAMSNLHTIAELLTAVGYWVLLAASGRVLLERVETTATATLTGLLAAIGWHLLERIDVAATGALKTLAELMTAIAWHLLQRADVAAVHTLNNRAKLLTAIDWLGWLLLERVGQFLLLNEASLVIRADSARVLLLLLMTEASLVVGTDRARVLLLILRLLLRQARVLSTKGKAQDATNDKKLTAGQLGKGHVVQSRTNDVLKAQDLPVVAPVQSLVSYQTADLLQHLRRQTHDLLGGRFANDGNVPLGSRQSVSKSESRRAGP